MLVNINKEVVKLLESRDLGIKAYILLLSIESQEELWEFEDVSIYLLAQKLQIMGYITTDEEESDQLWMILPKGSELLEQLKELE